MGNQCFKVENSVASESPNTPHLMRILIPGPQLPVGRHDFRHLSEFEGVPRSWKIEGVISKFTYFLGVITWLRQFSRDIPARSRRLEVSGRSVYWGIISCFVWVCWRRSYHYDPRCWGGHFQPGVDTRVLSFFLTFPANNTTWPLR